MTRTCRLCVTEKPIDQFGVFKNNGIEGSRKVCKSCIRSRTEEWTDNKESFNHGLTGYVNFKCRCDICVSARSDNRFGGREFMAQVKLQSGCVDCGYNEYACALDFDHRPGETKTRNIASMVGFSLDKIIEEMSKCDVVCANCHRIRTSIRNGGLLS